MRVQLLKAINCTARPRRSIQNPLSGKPSVMGLFFSFLAVAAISGAKTKLRRSLFMHRAPRVIIVTEATDQSRPKTAANNRSTTPAEINERLQLLHIVARGALPFHTSNTSQALHVKCSIHHIISMNYYNTRALIFSLRVLFPRRDNEDLRDI